MKVLSPRLHGCIDYAVVCLFALAPTLFGFSGTVQILCYVLAAVHLLMTLLTAFPLGAVKLVPFPVHGGIEAVVVVGLIAAPWLLGFAAEQAARTFFLVSAGAIALVWFLTDYHGVRADSGAAATGSALA